MLECTREQLALQVYFRQLNHPQASFSVKQKRQATLNEVVAATIEMETYLPPKTAALVTEVKHSSEANLDAIAPVTVSSLKRGDDKVQQMFDKIIQRLEALENARKPAMSSTSEVTCYRCGWKGHIARNCRQDRWGRHIQLSGDEQTRVRSIRSDNYTNSDVNTNVFSCNKDVVSAICVGGYQVEVEVHGVKVKFLVDSGAAVTLMEKGLWERISKNHPQKLGAYDMSGLVGVERSSLTIHDCATVNLQLGNREIETKIIVVSPLTTDAILGVDFL